jgi:hypothetical protein
MLESAKGTIDVVASEEWVIEQLHIDFTGKLRSGSPADGDIDYIVDRMGHCPVSMNLKPVTGSSTRLQLDPPG